MSQKGVDWSLFVGMLQRTLEVSDANELAFLVANETWHLVPYRQAAVFFDDSFGRPRLKAITGLVNALEPTPCNLWLSQVCAALGATPAEAAQARTLTSSDLPPELREGWAEWWPAYALFQPLVTTAGRRLGAVLYVRDDSWGEADLNLLRLLHQHYAHRLESFGANRRTLPERWQAFRRHPWWVWATVALLTALAFFPVRLTVLAPAEIIALQAEVVAAPTDGVVYVMPVQPNQPVTKGQLLFSLDDTTLRNKLDIARKTLEVARANALTAEQKSFDDLKSKEELAALQGQVREKEAEAAYLQELLGRIDVVAAHDGVFIYGDPNDWLGKPVVTGERIAHLAEPGDLGVLVWVPVHDAIALRPGAEMQVYLQVAPLQPFSARLIQTSYQATPSPEGVASYRIRGRLDGAQTVHIGLRGVAKIYGERVSLIYWVMRRPLGALRQWIGR